MTRFEARRRKRRKQKFQRAGAWALITLIELLISAAPAVCAAAIILPIVQEQRGYFAIGSEWLLISLLFSGTYYYLHRKICNIIFGEEA